MGYQVFNKKRSEILTLALVFCFLSIKDKNFTRNGLISGNQICIHRGQCRVVTGLFWFGL